MREMFEARVNWSVAGYEWLDCPGNYPDRKDDRFLVARRTKEGGWANRPYDLIRTEPGLFLAFADLEPTEDAIQTFANQYGCLSEWRSDWEAEILAMREAVATWHKLRSGEEDQRGMVRLAYHLADRAGWKNVTVQPRWEGRTLECRITLRELGAVLWTQFAIAVAEATDFRRCAFCHKPIPVGPDGHRTDKTTCSVACRNKLSRSRKKRARELRSEGKTLRQIAQELGVDQAAAKRLCGGKS